MFSSKCRSKSRLDGKTIVITGANTGIGKAIALDLLRRGGRIIMACRDLQRAESAANDIKHETETDKDIGELVLVKLNLASLASVRECAQHLLQTEKHIHILINNAGVCFCPKGLTEDGFEMHLGVNHLGHFLLTLLLVPRLIQSAPARIITVSSGIHPIESQVCLEDVAYEQRRFNTAKAYAMSKLANILFTKELANKLLGTGVTTYAVNPGAVATEALRHSDESMFIGAKWIYTNIICRLNKTPMQGAQTIIYCAVEESLSSESGEYYSECKKTSPSASARDPVKAKKLWEDSVRLVGVNDWDPLTHVKENNIVIESTQF